jgi:hypothetical protein
VSTPTPATVDVDDARFATLSSYSPTMRPCPLVYVCRGKGCLKTDGRDELLGALGLVAEVRPVKCQKVCKGVVVGVSLDNRLEWFERISKAKSRTALVEVVTAGTIAGLPDRLGKRHLTKRSGRPPR